MIVVGMDKDLTNTMGFAYSCVSSLASYVSSVGILPVCRFSWVTNTSRFVRRPSVSGSGPTKEFIAVPSSFRFVNTPSYLGILQKEGSHSILNTPSFST